MRASSDVGRYADAGIGDIEKATKAVFTNVFENLKNNAAVKADGPTRLFFPNGIELIWVIVKVNVKDGVDVEVKVAGEKGLKASSDAHSPGAALPLIPEQ